MKYYPGDKVVVHLDKAATWNERKLRLDGMRITIDRYAGLFDHDEGKIIDPDKRNDAHKIEDCYRIYDDAGEFVWTLSYFVNEEEEEINESDIIDML